MPFFLGWDREAAFKLHFGDDNIINDDIIRPQFAFCYIFVIKQVNKNPTIQMFNVPKNISFFCLFLPILLILGLCWNPVLQAVLLSGALPCRVVERDGVQQCANQPAHAPRPHARRGPQGAAQPHQGAPVFPLPLLCQQRSPERHLSFLLPPAQILKWLWQWTHKTANGSYGV